MFCVRAFSHELVSKNTPKNTKKNTKMVPSLAKFSNPYFLCALFDKRHGKNTKKGEKAIKPGQAGKRKADPLVSMRICYRITQNNLE